MKIKPIATFFVATTAGTAVALSPMVELDPKAALLVGIISGMFALVQNNIKKSLPENPPQKEKLLIHNYSIILSIGLAAIVAFAVLKAAQYDTPLSKTLVVSFAGCVGKLAFDGFSYWLSSKK